MDLFYESTKLATLSPYIENIKEVKLVGRRVVCIDISYVIEILRSFFVVYPNTKKHVLCIDRIVQSTKEGIRKGVMSSQLHPHTSSMEAIKCQ